MPHAGWALKPLQARRLTLQHLRQLRSHPGLAVGHLQEFGNGHGDPAVAAPPERSGEMVTAMERPAVIPQPGFRIGKVLGMQQKLLLRFAHIGFLFFEHTHFREKKHSHKQRIIP